MHAGVVGFVSFRPQSSVVVAVVVRKRASFSLSQVDPPQPPPSQSCVQRVHPDAVLAIVHTVTDRLERRVHPRNSTRPHWLTSRPHRSPSPVTI